MSKWYAGALIIAGIAECLLSVVAQSALAELAPLWKMLFLGSLGLGVVLVGWGTAGLLMLTLVRAPVTPALPLAQMVELEEEAPM